MWWLGLHPGGFRDSLDRTEAGSSCQGELIKGQQVEQPWGPHSAAWEGSPPVLPALVEQRSHTGWPWDRGCSAVAAAGGKLDRAGTLCKRFQLNMKAGSGAAGAGVTQAPPGLSLMSKLSASFQAQLKFHLCEASSHGAASPPAAECGCHLLVLPGSGSSPASARGAGLSPACLRPILRRSQCLPHE